ncbi:MAG TPA: alpha/beta hydrolase [Chitinophagaceae bacterium]|nr:alpha/beta hydrolase [Chitinophagaceae bacterium]
MKTYLSFFTSLVIGLLLFSCHKPIEQVSPPPNKVVAKTILDVSYGTDPLQKMDIYLPADRSDSSTKVLVLIHGGEWESGNKTDLNDYVDTMKKRFPDYAVFNINYRLSINGNNVFPTQENDTKAALQFTMDNATNYIVSKKIVLLGVSAGGHLALLQAYKYNSPIIPKAVISFYAPTDLTELYNDPTSPLIPPALAVIVGKTPAQDASLYSNSSPINFVSSSSPPTLLFHGGIDSLVKPSQSVSLQMKLQANGVINQYVFYPSKNHGWTGATLSDSFNKIQSFLASNVK